MIKVAIGWWIRPFTKLLKRLAVSIHELTHHKKIAVRIIKLIFPKMGKSKSEESNHQSANFGRFPSHFSRWALDHDGRVHLPRSLDAGVDGRGRDAVHRWNGVASKAAGDGRAGRGGGGWVYFSMKCRE